MFRFFPSRKAQVAVEYLMIVGFIAALVIPTIFLYYSYASESIDDINKVQIDRLGRNIIETAERFYYYGHPSKVTIRETMPANVISITVEKDGALHLLIINASTGGQNSTFSFPTRVKINGTFGPRSFIQGEKKIRIEAAPGEPLVTINMEDGQCETSASPPPIANSECFDNDGDANRDRESLCFNGVLITDSGICPPGCTDMSGNFIAHNTCFDDNADPVIFDWKSCLDGSIAAHGSCPRDCTDSTGTIIAHGVCHNVPNLGNLLCSNGVFIIDPTC